MTARRGPTRDPRLPELVSWPVLLFWCAFLVALVWAAGRAAERDRAERRAHAARCQARFAEASTAADSLRVIVKTKCVPEGARWR
jgi:hypothetical protein